MLPLTALYPGCAQLGAEDASSTLPVSGSNNRDPSGWVGSATRFKMKSSRRALT
jgi:hypothetical protein